MCTPCTLSVLSLWVSDEHPGIFQDYLAALQFVLSLLRVGQSAANTSLPSADGILLLSRFMKISEISGLYFFNSRIFLLTFCHSFLSCTLIFDECVCVCVILCYIVQDSIDTLKSLPANFRSWVSSLHLFPYGLIWFVFLCFIVHTVVLDCILCAGNT